MKHAAVFILLFFATQIAQAQNDNPTPIWFDIPETAIPLSGERQIKPNLYRTVRADASALKTLLFSAPNEGVRPVVQREVILAVPVPDGGFQQFRVARYQMMEPELAAQFPEIGTWHGVSDDKTLSTIRLGWTVRGFHATVYSRGGSYFVDPYSTGNTTDYVSYYKKDYPEPAEAFACHTETLIKENLLPEIVDEAKVGDCVFRSYRLAVATTGEYSNFHNAEDPSDVDTVLASVVIAVNRVNQVYERELAVRLVLIAGTTSVFYYDPATDPYTNGNGVTMLTENQNNLNLVIGSANFDIGHVFSTGGGGVATLNGPCGTSKARGVTGLSSPVGDPFYIDYVAHEMGHQFGARHTFNNSCDNNRNNNTAMEPGSGSTIMAYAGICPPNIQSNSDDYFHAVNLQEIRDFVSFLGGSTCDTPIPFDNDPPVVNDVPNYTIPISTPFVLSAVATDPDGDPLTYCWEQWDNEIGAVMPPASANMQGPMFRSFSPSSSPHRYFPRLQDLVNNVSPTWEVLSSVTRPLEFRVTVRDFADMTAGCTKEDNLFVNVNAAAGPFLVTAPNTAVTWAEGQMHTVIWEVALTDQAPVSCANVDIFLSYDGGFTYPVTLAAGVPNNGSAQVILPAGATNTARVMVKGAGNIFFDISNTNFTIQLGAPDFAMGATPSSALLCPVGSADFDLEIVSFGGFSDPVTLSVSGAPTNTTVAFSTNPVAPTGSSVLMIGNLAMATPGVYLLMVTGASMGNIKNIPILLTILEVPAAIALTAPANDATDIVLFPTLSWTGDINANGYEWQVSTSPAFSGTVASGTSFGTTAPVSVELPGGTQHYWRVRGLGICGGTGAWSAIRSFTTVPCLVFNSVNVPVSISGIGMPVVNSTLTITENGTLTDVNVVGLSGTHSWISDLRITLVSPNNTEILLFDQPCMDQDNFNLNYDAQAATSTLPCPPVGGGTYRPVGTLNSLNGQEINGVWTLRIEDSHNEDGGQLSTWGIRVCPTAYSGILPVEWLEFQVEAVEQQARLSWATASESNNAGFEVQRQTAQTETFLPIAWIPAQGDGHSRTDYHFTDLETPKGLPVYYRLRQLDHDGQEDYSVIRSLTLPADNQAGWRLFPNPAQGYCVFESNSELMFTEVIVSLVNAQGQVVLQDRFRNPRFELDLTGLPSGIYQVQVQGEGSFWAGRMINLVP